MSRSPVKMKGTKGQRVTWDTTESGRREDVKMKMLQLRRRESSRDRESSMLSLPFFR